MFLRKLRNRFAKALFKKFHSGRVFHNAYTKFLLILEGITFYEFKKMVDMSRMCGRNIFG